MESLINKLISYTDKNFINYCKQSSLEDLYNLKKHCDNHYYNGLSEIILNDNQYDLLKKYIISIDPYYKKQSGATIPNKKDVYNIPINLDFYLGSIDCFSNEDDKQISRWLNKQICDNLIITEKLDGVSALLTINNDNYRLTTKGDGKIGCDISHIVPYIKNIPKNINKNISVRGELIMRKDVFRQKYNSKYKTARNMVAGIIKKQKEELRDIDFVVYEIVDFGLMDSQSHQLKKLNKMGFSIVKSKIIDYENINIGNLEEELTFFKQQSDYEIDGIIINVNNSYERDNDKDPEYMFAFKTKNTQSIETEIKDIEWSISKWGQLIPVIVINEINIGGVSISRISGNNAKNIIDNLLGIGAVVKVIRSKDVIPFISDVIQYSDNIKFPEYEYIWDNNKTHFLLKTLTNDVLQIITSKYIASFFDKLNIKYVNEMSCLKLVKNGYDNLIKILSLKSSDIENIEGLGKKSSTRIIENIHKGLVNVSVAQLLSASGVFGYSVGTKRVENLLLNIPDLLSKHKGNGLDDCHYDYRNVLRERILNIEGFSDIMTDKILDNLDIAIKLIDIIEPFVKYKVDTRINNDMVGMKFVFTGTRNKEVEKKVEDRGGSIGSSVSKKTTALIVNNITNSSKIDNAKKYDIKIYTMEEFCNKYGFN